jgi:AP endonuclease-1
LECLWASSLYEKGSLSAYDRRDHSNHPQQGFKSYVEAEDPDILILTETKVASPPESQGTVRGNMRPQMNNASLDPFLNRFPHRYWSFASKAGYGVSDPCGARLRSHSCTAGTAIFSKVEPREVTYILPDHPNKDVVKGRLVTFEFENLWLIGTYVVNAGEKLKV